MLGRLCIIITIAVLAIFFKSDCDLYLFLLPKPPVQAFQGQVVWITGASSGIGASLAADFAKSGAQVVISARRHDRLVEVANKCSQDGGIPPMILPMDVTDLKSHEQAVKTVIDKFGKIDVLVLNAGRSQRNLAIDTDMSDTKV